MRWLLCFVIVLTSCGSSRRGVTLMRWVEKPVYQSAITSEQPERRLHFDKVGGYTLGDSEFTKVRTSLCEGDVIAYRMKKWEARRAVATGNLTRAGYRLLDYGHLAILTETEDGLRLFSSHSFKGPNTEEGLETLELHSFDVYRLNQWAKVDHAKFHEFVTKAQEKSGNWIGYDFSGMFGLWNSKLNPEKADEIGHDYICSTVVAAALYYAGADMKVSSRKGYLDLVSPKQVISSHGVLRKMEHG